MSVYDYARTFYRHAGNRLFLLLAIVVAGGFVEVLGVGMLLPILSVGTGTVADDPFSGVVWSVFSFFGFVPTLGALLSLLVAVFAVKAVIVFAHRYLANWVTVTVHLDLQTRIAQLFSAASYQFYAATTAGYLNNVIVREVQRFAAAFAEFTRVPLTVIYIVAYATTSAIIRPDLTAALLAAGVLAVLLLRGFVRRTKEYSLEFSAEFGGMQSRLIQMIHNFIYLKATNSLSHVMRHIRGDIVRLARLNLKFGLMSAILKAVNEPIAVALLALLVFYQVDVEGSSLNEILVLGLLLYRVVMQVLQLQAQWQRFNQEIGGVYAVEAAIHDLEAQSETTGPRRLDSVGGDIRYRNVSYAHGNDPVLRDVTLDIEANHSVGIVGPSGAGKTTFFHLLTGMLIPDDGEITIDGTSYRDLDMASLRERIGYVTQDPAILDDTVGNNIAFWRCNPDDRTCADRIRRAATLANCNDLTTDLNARLGEKGIRLSGGQRQRIAIARELFKEPQLLIFDEATSALDSHSEAVIQESLESIKGKRTMVIIAHRLSTVRNCEKIYVFSEGRVVESGGFEELFQREGSLFRSMCRKQNIQI